MSALAESWNGTRWAIKATSTPPGTAGQLLGVSCGATKACVAVGVSRTGALERTLAESWNGTAWRIVPSPNPSTYGDLLDSVSCSSRNACVAVGTVQLADSDAAPLAEAWNGVAWHALTAEAPSGALTSNLSGVSCPAPTACEAVGSAFSTTGRWTAIAESWDGTSWRLQAPPNPSGSTFSAFDAVSCWAVRSCMAVGERYHTASEQYTLAESLSGSAWTVRTTPDPSGVVASVLFGVSCASRKGCVGVGDSLPTTVRASTLVEVWNGTAWRLQATPNPTAAKISSLNAVSCSGAECLAVGSSIDGYGDESTLSEIER